MPFEVEVFPDRRFGAITFTGAVTPCDMTAALGELCGRKDWMPGFDVLWDLRGIGELIATTEDTEAFLAESERLAPRLGFGRSAVVARRELAFSYLYLLQTRMRKVGREQRTFRTLDEALTWLEEGGQDDLEGVREWLPSVL